jgi:hypothetical protein
MARKSKAKPLPPDWVIESEATINNRKVVPGTEVSIKGERGRFRFIQRVVRPERGVEWLDFWGGPKGSEAWRSFHPDKVKRIHRIKTTGKSLLEERKLAA